MLFCEKCDNEIANRLVGDELAAYCPDCKWYTYEQPAETAARLQP